MPRSELVQSVLRGLDVVELVAQSERGLSLSEVCAALKLKQPTAHNLIRTLIAREIVEKTASPVLYRLGPAFSRLAAERTNQSLMRRAADVLTQLFERIRTEAPSRLSPEEEVSLTFAQAVAGEVVMNLRLRAQRPGVLERPRHVFSAYQSAAALVFQAYWSAEELEAFMRRHPFEELGLNIWKTEERYRHYLQKVRESGYASPPVFPLGQVRLAVPVFGAGQELVGALGLGIWLKSILPQKKKLLDEMVAAADRIAEK